MRFPHAPQAIGVLDGREHELVEDQHGIVGTLSVMIAAALQGHRHVAFGFCRHGIMPKAKGGVVR
jgi:hypothetical protein